MRNCVTFCVNLCQSLILFLLLSVLQEQLLRVVIVASRSVRILRGCGLSFCQTDGLTDGCGPMTHSCYSCGTLHCYLFSPAYL